jgi:hypothetical protein
MPLPFAADLSTIMNVDEFAVSVSYDGGTINAIFDNETMPVEAGGFVQVHQEQPRLTCRTIDVPSIAEGQAMVIAGTNYVIRAWIHDGTGVTTLRLEKS